MKAAVDEKKYPEYVSILKWGESLNPPVCYQRARTLAAKLPAGYMLAKDARVREDAPDQRQRDERGNVKVGKPRKV